jgi:hypothetical protein
MNPLFWFCLMVPCFGCPWRDDDHRKDAKEKAALREENSRLRQLAIENGINYGGSIYVTGQKPS